MVAAQPPFLSRLLDGVRLGEDLVEGCPYPALLEGPALLDVARRRVMARSSIKSSRMAFRMSMFMSPAMYLTSGL